MPRSSITQRSKKRKRSASGCNTTRRVRERMRGPQINLSRMTWPVGASTAAKGSSIITNSASLWYAARAIATRALWPPESVMPRPPIVTLSPPGKTFRSSSRDAADRASL
mmetsp:Transcript_125973/g.268789  ORF Transcript_125973/g.268789 Transcript_125973/m.268789 type:complete len:110 (-) Transcript_125973:2035-2364(-)